MQGDVLIGADGIWSNVRASATPRGTTRHMLPRILVLAPPHTLSLSHTIHPPQVRASMTGTASRGDESGVTYSGYTVFAGELDYDGGDPECGYKVYIGPGQYFVITDIGRGRYQWCALLYTRPAARTGRYAYYAHACYCCPTILYFLLPTTIYRYAFLARPADSEASLVVGSGYSR